MHPFQPRNGGSKSVKVVGGNPANRSTGTSSLSGLRKSSALWGCGGGSLVCLELPFYARKPFGNILVAQGEQFHIICESRYFFFNEYDFLSRFQSLSGPAHLRALFVRLLRMRTTVSCASSRAFAIRSILSLA